MHLLSSLATSSIDLACAVLILYCLTILGHSVRSLLPPSEWSPTVAVLWNAYLGLTTAAVVITLLGMAGWFSRTAFGAVLATGPLLNVRDRRALFAPWQALYGLVRLVAEERLAMLLLALPAVVTLVATALPEIFYDALYYHLGLPQQYLLTGTIDWHPAVVHSAFPAYVDVLFGLCLGIGGPGTAKFFNLLLFVLAWSATAAFVLEVLGELRTALAAAVTIATVPGVVIMSTMCGIDTALIGFSAMSFLSVVRVRHAVMVSSPGEIGAIAAGGATAGFVAGSKYTGLWLIAVLAAALLAKRHWTATLRMAVTLAAVSLVIASPWYLRNLWASGDPLYPVIKGALGDPDALWTLQRLQRDVLPLGLAWTLPADLLKALFFAPARFGAGAEVGILVPVGGIALVIGALRERELRPWALALALYLLMWMSVTGVVRYLYPMFPLCALGMARLTAVLAKRWPRSRLGFSLAVLLVLAPLSQSLMVLNNLYVGADAAALFSGTLSRDEYLARRLAYYPAARWINTHTDVDARVLYLGETRLLYLDRQVTLMSAYDMGHFDRLLATGAAPLWTEVKRLGVTHILINGREIDRLRNSYDYLSLTAEQDRQLKTALERCRIVFRQSGVQICEVPHEVG